MITGDKDPIVSITDGAKSLCNIKNAEHLTLRDAGHLAMLEKPNEFVSSVKEFLSL